MNICIRIKKKGLGANFVKLLPFVILNAFCLWIDSAYAGKSTCTTAFAEKSDTLLTQYRHIEHFVCLKFWCQNINIWQNDSFVNFFPSK